MSEMSSLPGFLQGQAELRRSDDGIQTVHSERECWAEAGAFRVRDNYDSASRHRPDATGVGLVVLIHLLALCALCVQRPIERTVEQALEVRIVAPRSPPALAPTNPVRVQLTLHQPELHLPRLEPPKLVIAYEPAPEAVSPSPVFVSASTVVSAIPAPVASAPEVSPAPPAPAPAPVPVASDPVALSGELALACPDRTPPSYPASARRLGETGQVMLRVELDERGDVSAVKVEHSSGSTDLDQAALVAVRAWHCQPPKRNGQAVRAVAMQPFNFTLRGH